MKWKNEFFDVCYVALNRDFPSKEDFRDSIGTHRKNCGILPFGIIFFTLI
jgi:hypothetical protein